MEKKENIKKILEFYVMTFTLSSYTMYETKLWLRVIQHCQRDIRLAVTQQSKGNNCLAFTPTEESEQMRHVKIPLRKLEPSRTHIARARQAFLNMEKKAIYILCKKDDKSIGYVHFPQLFKVSFSPAGEKNAYVILHIKLAVLRRYLSNSFGYHYLDLDTYFGFKHFATRQMYRFYCAYFVRGVRTMLPSFLIKTLSPQGTYNSYASLKKNLLEVARTEIEHAYQQERCNFHFTYHPLYKDEGNKGIQADNIIFKFIAKEDEHLSEEKQAQLNGYQHRINMKLKLTWSVDPKQAYLLSSRITYPMQSDIDIFFHHQEWFAKDQEKKGHPIRNLGGYMYSKLKKLLDELEKE